MTGPPPGGVGVVVVGVGVGVVGLGVVCVGFGVVCVGFGVGVVVTGGFVGIGVGGFPRGQNLTKNADR